MAISLQKGQKVDLTKTNPSLSKIVVGLGWDVKKYDSGSDFDLDASAFIQGANGKVRSDADFIFYNNLKDTTGAVQHMGDNRTGEGEGDDEQIKIDLKKLSPDIEKISFVVTIHDAIVRNQNFGQISNSFIRVFNEETNQEIVRFDLGEDFSVETAIVVGEVYKHNGEWKFAAIGSGFQGGLEAMCRNFGINV